MTFRRVWPLLVIIAFLGVGGPLGALSTRIGEVQNNDSAAYLPRSAEATRVQALMVRFGGPPTLPATIVYTRAGGLTADDRTRIAGDLRTIADRLGDRLAGPPRGPLLSRDGEAAEVVVAFASTDPRKNSADIHWLRATTGAHVGGPAGVLADLLSIFDTINGVLLAATASVILLILVVVYRSPILPFVVLGVAGVALASANGIVYLLAKHGVITLSGQTQGILDVLVLGAGTDYALLMVARFREELRRHDDPRAAVKVAWRACIEPILASGGTVILGLLCLLASDLASSRAMGPASALGIGCGLVCMLGLLPAVLALLGRTAFWPFKPTRTVKPVVAASGVWDRVAAGVGRHPRRVWLLTALLLLACTGGIARLQAHGIPQTQAFLHTVDSRTAEAVLGQHFPPGTGSPTIVIGPAAASSRILAVVLGVPGVTDATPFPGGTRDGLVRVDATLGVAPDAPEADRIVERLRAALTAIPGTQVGGYTASNYDVQKTTQRDRDLIIPLVLLVVFLVLVLLLRALLAPLLLVATVVLSFFATLGVSGVMFRDVFSLVGADSSFPLFAFVFLVALGVDYNIFLMTRVREEVRRRGHRDGTLAGLAVTGGVITSAGVVLAATFAALAVLPIVFLAELAFAVAFGVLLDTLVVRSLLVPALTVDAGPVVWWPASDGHGHRLGHRRRGERETARQQYPRNDPLTAAGLTGELAEHHPQREGRHRHD